ncbi:type II toxin-antitoxin system VapC family toxin, partial [Candidatus Woesearchaeota archaeon]|nr:type II toxin-antitoxin system VapC family toxin [Candidatus Woesearchaeota archaeon]
MIYLDVNVFVYAFLRTDEVGNKSRALLDKVVKGHLPAITSYLTFDEFFWNVNKLSAKETTLSYTQNLLQTPNLTFVAIDTEIISKAYELLKTYNLGPRDAIHAATAILSGAT